MACSNSSNIKQPETLKDLSVKHLIVIIYIVKCHYCFIFYLVCNTYTIVPTSQTFLSLYLFIVPIVLTSFLLYVLYYLLLLIVSKLVIMTGTVVHLCL